MLKLYFGNLVNTVTTLLLVVLLGFLGVSLCHRAAITGWGRRTLLALVLGLVICCFAAARDGLDKTIQNAIDGPTYRERLEADPEAKLTPEQLDAIFDPWAFLTRKDRIFARLKELNFD